MPRPPRQSGLAVREPVKTSYQKLFVYGLLKKGFPLHHFLESSGFVGEGYISGYAMYSLGSYPVVVQLPPGTVNKVHGEIYNTPIHVLHQLDQLEGAYDKDYALVLPQKTTCNIYTMDAKRVAGRFRWIPDGIWRTAIRAGRVNAVPL